jgi:hypothetical protein
VQPAHDSYSRTFRWIDRVREWQWLQSPKGCPRCPDLHETAQGQSLDLSVRVNFDAHQGTYPPGFGAAVDWI